MPRRARIVVPHFYSCLLEGEHYWSAIRYVERNPVRAGLVARAQDYPWSSAGWRCGLRRDDLLPQPGPLDWPQWLWNVPRPPAIRVSRGGIMPRND